MGGPVWKRINVVDPRAVNGLNVAGYGLSGPEKSCILPSLVLFFVITCETIGTLDWMLFAKCTGLIKL